MKIYILRTKNSETAPKITKHLKNCQEGYDYPKEKCFIVNFGRKTNKANLNNKLVHNKLKQLLTLKEKGMNIPKIIDFNPKDIKKVCKKIVCKYLPRDMFPVMARKERHFKGKDIIFLKSRGSLWKRLDRISKREFFVKYIPKEAEFRVHVLGDEVVNICKKVHSKSVEKHHPHVWCSPRGWTLVDYEGKFLDKLKDVGKKAVKALGYDFGAVDIGLGKDGKFYVFEINSAPRLNKARRSFYAKYFRQKEKEYKNEVAK